MNYQQKLNVLPATITHSELKEFDKLAEYLHKNAGIFLPHNEKNIALMTGRLRKLLSNYNLTSYSHLLNELLSENKELKKDFVESMTTNTTFFFREPQHFDFLSQALPQLVEQKLKKGESEIKVWCAAASNGAEPYSLAMTLANTIQNSRIKIRILATDIDSMVLKTALHGVYSEKEIENIPPHFSSKFLVKGRGESEGSYRIKKEIRQLVTFSEFNLLTPSYPFKSKFDFIFCRNVFIYFTPTDVINTVNKMKNHIEQGGYLFVGHSESLMTSIEGLVRKSPAVYQKTNAIGTPKKAVP